MRVATVDIGTNTVLLLVAERNAQREVVAVRERATITRLGQGVDKTRKLLPEAVERTRTCLASYAKDIAELGVASIDVVGTSAMRDAGGSEEIRTFVRDRFGVDARVISGDEEARLTFKGALSGLTHQEGPVVVFDIGGGSTEIVRGQDDSILFSTSIDIGSVRLTERHIHTDPPSSAELEAARNAAKEAFSSLPENLARGVPVGIAGTMTTLSAVAMKMHDYDGARVHGSTLSGAKLSSLVMELASMPLDERKKVPGLEPKRADVIVAGGLIALAVLERLGADEAQISDRGVRWGLAEQLLDVTRA